MGSARETDSPEILERFSSELALVDIVASQVARRLGSGGQLELGDLVSAGREGLLDAARRFDPARGVPFRAYANYRVLGSILGALRRSSALPRRLYERVASLEAAALASEGQAAFAYTKWTGDGEAENTFLEHLTATATAAALGLVCGEAALDPEAVFERAELMARVRLELESLERHEAEVVRRHYFEGHRLEDIATDLGFGKSWASRLHTRAITKLAKRLRDIE